MLRCEFVIRCARSGSAGLFFISLNLVVGRLAALLLHLQGLAVACYHALCGPVVPEHEVVGAEHARGTPLDLRFLNLHCLLQRPLHEVVLAGRVRPQRLAVLTAHLLDALTEAWLLPRTQHLHTALHLATWALTAAQRPFRSGDQSPTHAGATQDLARTLLLRVARLTQAAAALRLILVDLREGTQGTRRLVLGVRAEQAV